MAIEIDQIEPNKADEDKSQKVLKKTNKKTRLYIRQWNPDRLRKLLQTHLTRDIEDLVNPNVKQKPNKADGDTIFNYIKALNELDKQVAKSDDSPLEIV